MALTMADGFDHYVGLEDLRYKVFIVAESPDGKEMLRAEVPGVEGEWTMYSIAVKRDGIEIMIDPMTVTACQKKEQP